MNLKISTFVATISLFASFCSCHLVSAQDLMARQARIDRQLKAVDSVSLQRVTLLEMSEMVSDIYADWSNNAINIYKETERPASYKIDLTGFSMPTTSRQITSNYGYRRSFRRNHYGLDVKVYTGDTIYAAFDGKARIVSYEGRGYGYYILLRHPNGLETLYGHLSKQLIDENDIVKSGQPIGLGGNTGRSTGSHLHFETRFMGEPINPELLFDFPAQDVTGDSYVYHNKNYRGHDIYASVENKELRKEIQEAKSDRSQSSGPYYHKVKKGDTLFSIARDNSLTVKQLCSLNRISKKSKLRLGQILKCK